jgi:hypothetical protein
MQLQQKTLSPQRILAPEQKALLLAKIDQEMGSLVERAEAAANQYCSIAQDASIHSALGLRED